MTETSLSFPNPNLDPIVQTQPDIGRIALTELQREHTASRIMHDAELIKGGASIDEHGGLRPSSAQINNLYHENIIEPQKEEFMASPSGTAIDKINHEINFFMGKIHGNMGNAMIFDNSDDFEVSRKFDFRGWVKQNRLELDINCDLLDSEAYKSDLELRKDSYSSQTIHTLRRYQTALNELTYDLIRHPQLQLNSTVTVKRNGKNGEPDYLEDGWKVASIYANGNLKVVSPDGTASKSQGVKSLASLNKLATS